MSNESDAQIKALENILKREREARKKVEKKLETFSREIYESNEQLRAQTAQAEDKQTQLSFLTGLAAETWKKDNFTEIISNYLERCSDFLFYPVCVFLQLEIDYKVNYLQIVQSKNIDNPTYQTVNNKAIIHLFSQLDGFKLRDAFQQSPESQLLNLTNYMDNTMKVTKLPFCFLYAVPLYYLQQSGENNIGLACFFYRDDKNISINKLQTIESSRSTLTLAIERKRADKKLQRQIKELEEINNTLEKTQQQLVETEKLASLGMLSAGVAHEINNPVGYVKSNLETMQEYLESLKRVLTPLNNQATLDQKALLDLWEKEEGQFLLDDSESILSSSLTGLERIKEIVSALRAFSRMDNHDLEPVDINVIIKNALKMLQNELKYDYEILTELRADKQILGSEGQLQQVLINLLVNAKHAMPMGGKITISTYTDKARVVVKVKDDGCGISPENLKDIFNPFFTTKPPGEGTGLGLSISYSILKQHHAKVDVNSEIDRGTEFTMSFFAFE